ncbi:MAG: hypothetical protein IJL96_06625 [Clostridia bacterium]|nr:hypothetical protein [Clostridia bacterium]
MPRNKANDLFGAVPGSLTGFLSAFPGGAAGMSGSGCAGICAIPSGNIILFDLPLLPGTGYGIAGVCAVGDTLRFIFLLQKTDICLIQTMLCSVRFPILAEFMPVMYMFSKLQRGSAGLFSGFAGFYSSIAISVLIDLAADFRSHGGERRLDRCIGYRMRFWPGSFIKGEPGFRLYRITGLQRRLLVGCLLFSGFASGQQAIRNRRVR